MPQGTATAVVVEIGHLLSHSILLFGWPRTTKSLGRRGFLFLASDLDKKEKGLGPGTDGCISDMSVSRGESRAAKCAERSILLAS